MLMLAEHVRFLNEVAMISGRPKVETLLRVLEAQGQSVVSPSGRKGLHPLFVPLAELDGTVTGLLRWPDANSHRGMELPVVSMQRNQPAVTLVARSPEECIHRWE